MGRTRGLYRMALVLLSAFAGACVLESEKVENLSGAPRVTMEVFHKAQIQSDTGKCLAAAEASDQDATPVHIWECDDALPQYWDIRSDGTIHPRKTPAKCLALSGFSDDSGAEVVLRDCADTERQRWQVTSAGPVRNISNGKCLDIPSPVADDGAAVQTLDCQGGAGQQFDVVPKPFNYVALGDSYAAGAGLAEELGDTRQFDDDGGCERHLDAYPARVAMALQARDETQTVEFDFVACSGDRIADAFQQMQANQDVLGRADLVTVTIGGNDLDWPDVLERCATVWNRNPLAGQGSCTHGKEELFQRVDGMLQRLEELNSELRSFAPRAQILLVGYPQIAPLQPKSACIPFLSAMIDAAEREMIRALGVVLNDGFAAVAEASSRTSFVDLQVVYEGHEPCAQDEWINALRSDFSSSQSFHPKVIGHQNAALAVMQAVL